MNQAFLGFDENVAATAEAELAGCQPAREAHGRHFKPEERTGSDPDRDDDGKIHCDDPWDVFIPDDDELDPLPEPGDFWIEPDE
jgi:hypothetical protein